MNDRWNRIRQRCLEAKARWDAHIETMCELLRAGKVIGEPGSDWDYSYGLRISPQDALDLLNERDQLENQCSPHWRNDMPDSVGLWWAQMPDNTVVPVTVIEDENRGGAFCYYYAETFEPMINYKYLEVKQWTKAKSPVANTSKPN